MAKDDTSLKELLQELAEQRNVDFRGYKKTTLERRFRRRMFQLNLGSFADYGDYIRRRPAEINELLNTLLINVTEFFRDPPAWEILRHEILPRQLKRVKPGHSFRAWSAGCASGEEPYSIAILLAEHFGSSIQEYDVKIYATDIDDEALSTARRAEYSAEGLRRVRSEWRDRYFHGKGPMRVNRDIRRLVIFGRSNLAQDAPISHVDLLVCRNVLIYFNSDLQKQILTRLHYALEPAGILFLGKSESQLSNSQQFQRLNSRWRVFQRMSNAQMDEREPTAENSEQRITTGTGGSDETDRLRQQQRTLLETLRLGIIGLGGDDIITQHNMAALSLCGLAPANLVGKRLVETDLFMRISDLPLQLQATRTNNESSHFPARVKIGSEVKLIEVTIRPLLDENGQRSGTFIYLEDQTVQEKLQTTVEELESTSEELQSANEELETTNEELETTNEELQSTNEELETTNEELQSLNEELETTNQELEERTKELDQVNSVYAQTLEKIRLPVMLVNQERRIEFWNSTALRMFGFKSRPPVDLTMDQLPLPKDLKKLLIRRHRAALVKEQPLVARAKDLGAPYNSLADIHFSLIPRDDRTKNVLIMFERIASSRNDAAKEGPKRLRRP